MPFRGRMSRLPLRWEMSASRTATAEWRAQVSAADWFWTGRNNAVDRGPCGVRFEVGAVKFAAYWAGVTYGLCARVAGAEPRS